MRENNFDFIRLFLAMLVIFSHSFPLATGSEVSEPLNLLTKGQATFGSVAVNLFFVISGFLIAQSWENSRTIWSYLGKRFRRIYPGFIALMLLSAWIICRGHISPVDFLLQTARLQEFQHQPAFHNNPTPNVMNGSLWSISFEFWCYLGVAFLGLTGLVKRRWFLLALFVCSLGVSILFPIYGWRPGGGWVGAVLGYPPFWARLLPLYLSGMIFYSFRDKIGLNLAGGSISAIALTISALFPPFWTLIFPLAGAYLTIWLVFHSKIRLHGFARYGDFSYGVYLYAYPVQQTVVDVIGHAVNPMLLFSIATPITLGFGFLSWHGVEKWFLKKRTLEATLDQDTGKGLTGLPDRTGKSCAT